MAATRISNMKREYALSRNASPPSNSIFERKRRWIKVQKQFEGFAYDGANVRLEFVDPDGSGALPAVLTTRYFNGPGVDNIIAQENFAGSQFAQGTYWHMKNYLGSTTDLIAAAEDGGHQNHITYDSYGNVVSQTNASVGSRYMYTGREYDAETGLQYYRARYYDSSTGRFLSEDPIGFAAGPNQYGYVGGNPIGFVDPLGLSGWLSIHTDVSLDLQGRIIGNHSWIEYVPDGATKAQAYGTWRGLGLTRDREFEFRSPTSIMRVKHIDDAGEARLRDLLKDYRKKSDKGWTWMAPCSSFAAKAWKAGTGEKLDDKGMLFSTPKDLYDAIRKKNSGDYQKMVPMYDTSPTTPSENVGVS